MSATTPRDFDPTAPTIPGVVDPTAPTTPKATVTVTEEIDRKEKGLDTTLDTTEWRLEHHPDRTASHPANWSLPADTTNNYTHDDHRRPWRYSSFSCPFISNSDCETKGYSLYQQNAVVSSAGPGKFGGYFTYMSSCSGLCKREYGLRDCIGFAYEPDNRGMPLGGGG